MDVLPISSLKDVWPSAPDVKRKLEFSRNQGVVALFLFAGTVAKVRPIVTRTG
jgi:hypothetical protein